jgi:large subunit ribosomal protein L4e
MSRVPRLTQGRRAALAPCVVGGRRAHPPKVERNWKEKINKKENKLAKNSALAATANTEIVTKRGHKFDDKLTLPLVVDDKFEKIKKTKNVIDALDKLGVYDDVLRATNGKHIRAGRGKSRGRKYKTPKSILIVSTKNDILKSSRNLTGVDVVNPKYINIEHLAPGGDPGRLTIFTKSALKEIGGDK